MTTAADILKDELATFESKKADLLATAEGKFVLIHDGAVVDTYVNEFDAIAAGYKKFGNKPFLVAKFFRLTFQPTL